MLPVSGYLSCGVSLHVGEQFLYAHYALHGVRGGANLVSAAAQRDTVETMCRPLNGVDDIP